MCGSIRGREGRNHAVNRAEIEECNLMRHLLLSLSNQGRVQTKLLGPTLPLIECGFLEIIIASVGGG